MDEPKKMGRPSSFTQEMADIICDQLSDGRSLRSVCSGEGMPAKITVLKWLRERPDFASQYARAKEESADTHADDLTDIADDTSQDFIKQENGTMVVNNEAIQRSRLRVDTRKWIASKLKPKKYGEKLDLEHTGIPAAAPATIIIKTG